MKFNIIYDIISQNCWSIITPIITHHSLLSTRRDTNETAAPSSPSSRNASTKGVTKL